MTSFLSMHGRGTRSWVVLFLLGMSSAAATGCGEETKPCEETQTCIPPTAGEGGEGGDESTGGSAGRGGNGASGGSAGRGGSAAGGAGGATGGSAGLGGTAGNGTSGDAGSGGTDDEAPTVVSITPADTTMNVERDIEVTVELSEAVDQATVTSTSVVLAAPNGAVSGTLTVDDNVITLLPDRPLSLLVTYTLSVEDTITDLAGNPLAQSESAKFSVREGAFGAPIHPFGTREGRLVKAVGRNAFGDMVVGTDTWTGNQVDAGIFDALENTWTTAELAQGNVYSAAMDSQMRAVTGLNRAAGFGWARYTPADDWMDEGDLGAYPTVVTSPDGMAMSVSRDPSATSFSSRTMNLSNGTIGSPLGIPLPQNIASDPFPVASLDDVAVVGLQQVVDDQEIYVLWNRGSGWGSPETVAHGTNPGLGLWSYASDEEGNIIVAWVDEDGLWARIYERENDAWTDPESVRASEFSATLYRPAISAGNAALMVSDASGTWVILHRAGVGWIASSALRIAEPGVSGGVAIDSSGNALAIWNADLSYRRYVAGSGWQAASDLNTNIDPNQLWVVGAPDGTAWALAQDLEVAANRGILAVRFE